MFRKVYLFFSWLFYGYFGLQKQRKESVRSRILRFSFRFFIFYIAILFLWSLFHLHYEALLWQISLRIGYLITNLPIGSPELNLQDKLFCHIGNLIVFPNTGWYTVCTITAVPLLLASSGIEWDKRLEMITIGIFILFFFQILCVFVGMYGWLYTNYPGWLSEERAKVYEIILYQQSHARMVCWVNHFFKVFFRHVVTLGVSIGLLSYYKKGSIGSFIEIFL